MSVRKWVFVPQKCVGDLCIGDCDFCPKADIPCETCKHAELDYEEYYGTTDKQWFVSGCELEECRYEEREEA